jgi:hypothetical protein
VDPVIPTTARGLWAIKRSFLILGVTAGLQLGIVLLSGSVAPLADTIHNVGDAATAVPLWMAFLFARRDASARFTYGFGRVEDVAGVVIVLIIVCSALVAGYEAVNRLLHPQPIALLGWVATAGVIGFVGNEGVAVCRIRVGREIDSVALIAVGAMRHATFIDRRLCLVRGRADGKLKARLAVSADQGLLACSTARSMACNSCTMSRQPRPSSSITMTLFRGFSMHLRHFMIWGWVACVVLARASSPG